METKLEKMNFTVADFDEEEKWLQEQHKAGWKFIKTIENKYYFEKSKAEDWIYQLDFKKNGMNEDNYIQLFADCGWEFILQYGKWFYFRKRKEEADIDTSIFSDNDSKISMCERVINGHLAIRIALFVVACTINALSIFTDVFKNGDGFWSAAIPWIGMGLMVAASYSFFDYRKLKNRIEALKNPIQ